MKILIVAATSEEIAPLIKRHQQNVPGADILITGVGMTATSFALGKHLANNTKYTLLLNAGIAGSFDKQLALGSVVNIYSDTLAELGAEDGEYFLPITELGFGENNFSNDPAFNHPLLTALPSVKSITVNCVHGNEVSIQTAIRRFGATTESMEGAAVFYAAQKSGIPAIQVRAISNYVEKRNKANWQIGLAIKNLNVWLSHFIEKQTEH